MCSLLDKPYINKQYISGLETYIIPPEHLESDRAYISDLMDLPEKYYYGLFDIVKNNADVPLFFCVIHIPNWKSKKRENGCYFPLLCLYYKKQRELVDYVSSWKCQDCGYIVEKDILMPQREYGSVSNRLPIPDFFEKKFCPQCNHHLQYYLLYMDNIRR